MPTTLLQVPRRTFGRLRVLPQVSRHLLWRLRVLPQVSRRLPWRLRVLPQVSRHLLWRLRESRKSSGIYFGVCGKSRKSPGICFDVCGKSRKCFGELVGRYSMLSMTFSIRASHSFVELTLCDTDIKPYRVNPYVKRTPYRPYTPPRKKEYPDRSAPRQNAGKSDQTLRIINHLRARSNSAFREAWRPVGRVDISISLRPVKKMIIKNEG